MRVSALYLEKRGSAFKHLHYRLFGGVLEYMFSGVGGGDHPCGAVHGHGPDARAPLETLRSGETLIVTSTQCLDIVDRVHVVDACGCRRDGADRGLAQVNPVELAGPYDAGGTWTPR